MDITIHITEDERKILETDILNIGDWVDNLIKAKINSLCRRYILEYTDKRPDRLSYYDKVRIVSELDIKSAKQRNKEVFA